MIEKDRLKQTVKEAPVLAEHRRPTKEEHGKGNDVTFKARGNDNTYLTARLKRDAPDIADRLERGEFKSVRAAAIEAEADKKAGDVLEASAEVKRGNPTGSNQYQRKEELPKSADSSQSVRAKSNGVHRDTQRKLDRLAKDRPDLIEKMRDGNYAAAVDTLASVFGIAGCGY